MADRFDHDGFDAFDGDFSMDDAETARLDEVIRRQLTASIHSQPAPPLVLDRMRRPLRRARLVHHTQVVAGAAAALAMTAGLLHLALGDRSDTTLVASSPTTSAEMVATFDDPTSAVTSLAVASSTTVGSDATGSLDNERTTEAAVPATSGNSSPSSSSLPTSATTSPNTTSSTISSTPVPTTTRPTTTRPAVPTTTRPTVPTTTPATAPTTAATSSTTADTDGSTPISSTCGTITVTASGSRIELDGTTPTAGFTAQVGNDGPEQIEVTMSGPPGSCEITATASQGQINSHATFEPSDDGDDHTDD